MKLIVINEQGDLSMVEVARLCVNGNSDTISFVDINGDEGEVIVNVKNDMSAVKDGVLRNASVIVLQGNVVS